MDQDTGIGGPATRFPTTRRSAVLAARSANPRERTQGLEAVAGAYWKPAYKYLRFRWRLSNEDAKDLVQGFFARALEKGLFEAYDPARSSFRTYLRMCLDGFVSNEKKSALRQKRSPAGELLSLDFSHAEQELRLEPPSREASPEEYFQKEWVRSLFALAIERLRAECARRGKEICFRLFELYDLEEGEPGEKVTYESLGSAFGLPVTTVTNHLAFARRELRRIVLETLRELTGSDQEFRSEARAVLPDGAP